MCFYGACASPLRSRGWGSVVTVNFYDTQVQAVIPSPSLAPGLCTRKDYQIWHVHLVPYNDAGTYKRRTVVWVLGGVQEEMKCSLKWESSAVDLDNWLNVSRERSVEKCYKMLLSKEKKLLMACSWCRCSAKVGVWCWNRCEREEIRFSTYTFFSPW